MSRFVILFGVLVVILNVFHAGQCAGNPATAPSASGSGAEPQVAVLCEAGAAYHPQYLSPGGWQSDLGAKPRACLKDKMDILDYCKKMYPSHDITNIVEASHYVKVSNWCKIGSNNAAKCKVTRWVKPFRCLEGPFQSDALLVPESCLFDHIHNQSRCWPFGRWNVTAGRACQQRGLRLRTFAMLLPCGISLFSGVEFVCCPKHFKDNVKMHKPLEAGVPVSAGSEDVLSAAAAMDERDDGLLDDEDDDDDDVLNLNDEDDDDDAADDDTDMDEDEDADVSREDDADPDGDVDTDDDYTDGDEADWPRDVSSSTTTTTTTTTTAQPSSTTTQTSSATSDPYYSHFDPRTEHQSYKDAQQRLEETHREKITKVMKDWSELEDRYQEMITNDPQGAQAFRQRMTAKFQASVQALEEAGVSERRRLAALHQQRVLAHLAQRRRTALACYTRSLQDVPPNTHRVQKCLQRLVRALGAERAGALAAWRRAVAAGHEAAEAERARARDRLQDADRALQRALAALRRKPHLYEKIGTTIEDYVQSMQSKDDMAVSLMSMTPEAEELLLDRIAGEVTRKQQAREQLLLQQKAKKEHRTRQRTEMQEERKRVSAVLSAKETEERDDEASEQDITTSQPSTSLSPAPAPASSPATPDQHTTTRYIEERTDSTTVKYNQDPTINEWSTAATASAGPRAVTVDSPALQDALEQAEMEHVPRPAHAMRHDISHAPPGFSVRGADSVSGGGAIYPALCVGGAALAAAAAVAVAVVRRRRNGAPSAQGFVQVEQTAGVMASPEERHVANMQINGYENPTYKYFEVKE